MVVWKRWMVDLILCRCDMARNAVNEKKVSRRRRSLCLSISCYNPIVHASKDTSSDYSVEFPTWNRNIRENHRMGTLLLVTSDDEWMGFV